MRREPVVVAIALTALAVALGCAEVSAQERSSCADSLALADKCYRQALLHYVNDEYDLAEPLFERALACLDATEPETMELRDELGELRRRVLHFLGYLPGHQTEESDSIDSTSAPPASGTAGPESPGDLVATYRPVAAAFLAELDTEDYSGRVDKVVRYLPDAAELELYQLDAISQRWSLAIQLASMTNLTVEEQLLTFTQEHEQLEWAAALDLQHQTAETAMRTLRSPPEGYSKTYDLVLELYSVYSQLVSLRQSPRGSLMTFNQTTGDLRLEIEKLLSKVAVTY